ncbi:FAD:protein FMN transferase [Candidatus Albibeggiatoa sp. nov. NOAA]|uniref:FAD:protein FMN transferase n=1 Tax=Candidatus Albibeggiatoa sp. nov. NOAA TaxID=3162724 RepID=UPI0032FEE6BE|nr:FAD:protein FMN transferase [Thiotrichaceae bacterium]
MLRKFILASLISVLLVACNPQNPYQERQQQQQFYVFGTLVAVTLWDVPKQTADQAFTDIMHSLQALHKKWHAWDKSSQVVALNQAIAQGQAYTIEDESLLDLLTQAQTLAAKSDYLFEPAIGKLIALWGFHQDEPHLSEPPALEAIEKLLAEKPSIADLTIEGNVVTSSNPAVQLDFGAYAKGYAVDMMVEKLKKLDIENAIVNAGGNLKVLGKAGERPWMIGVRHPFPTEEKSVLAAVAVEGELSVVTSGDYERYFEFDGKHYSHVIDPRTGQPTTQIRSVTVVDESATFADAAATALMVAGIENWYAMAKKMGVRYVLIVDQAGTVHLNPAMIDLAQFQKRDLPKSVISEPLI